MLAGRRSWSPWEKDQSGAPFGSIDVTAPPISRTGRGRPPTEANSEASKQAPISASLGLSSKGNSLGLPAPSHPSKPLLVERPSTQLALDMAGRPRTFQGQDSRGAPLPDDLTRGALDSAKYSNLDYRLDARMRLRSEAEGATEA